MEQEEKLLNPQESLRVIRETIDLAKSGLRENGFHFLLWGWLVVAACVGEYYLGVIMRYPYHNLVWVIMTVVGIPAGLIYEWRRDKKEPAMRNIIHDWYGRIWLAFGISLFITIALAAGAHLSPIPFILVLVGFATFVSGSILRFKPLIWGSIAMWAGGAICIPLAPEAHLLVQAIATILGYLIPGYLLNIKARNRHV